MCIDLRLYRLQVARKKNLERITHLSCFDGSQQSDRLSITDRMDCYVHTYIHTCISTKSRPQNKLTTRTHQTSLHMNKY